MRAKLLFIIPVLLLAAAGYFSFSGNIFTDPTATLPDPCQEPITFYIASIDNQFDMTKYRLRKVMKEVEGIWEKPIGKNLLEYQKDGEIGIHLIYGEAQQRMDREHHFSKKITTIRNKVQRAERRYQQLSSRYKQQAKQFTRSLEKYNQAVSEYNQKVKKWEQGSGIPISKKPAIEDMEQQIGRLKHTMVQNQKQAESLRKQTNTKSEELNNLIDRQQQLIKNYNKQFASVEKFDQGQYQVQGNSKRINIYHFSSRAGLKTVLAHEVGHALGLDHLPNPKAIMHAVMEEQDVFNLALTKDDIQAINKKCN